MLLMLKCLVIVIEGKRCGRHDDNLIVIEGKRCGRHDDRGIVIVVNGLNLVLYPKTRKYPPAQVTSLTLHFFFIVQLE